MRNEYLGVKMTNNENDDHDSNAHKMIGRGKKKKTTLKRVRIHDSFNINNQTIKEIDSEKFLKKLHLYCSCLQVAFECLHKRLNDTKTARWR